MQNLSSFRRPNTNKSVGIEWEMIDTLYSIDIGKYYGFFKATRDGSISSDSGQGVEFVSQPLSVAWLKKELLRLHRRSLSAQATIYNDSCGIHVHVSRKWCTKQKAKDIYAWLQNLAVSSPDLYKEMFGRMPNYYCRVDERFDSKSRYVAVNNKNKDTVEFRMFSSGDVTWACKCLDTVEWLINNHDHLNIDATEAFCLL